MHSERQPKDKPHLPDIRGRGSKGEEASIATHTTGGMAKREASLDVDKKVSRPLHLQKEGCQSFWRCSGLNTILSTSRDASLFAIPHVVCLAMLASPSSLPLISVQA